MRFVAGVSPAKLSAHDPSEPSLWACAAAVLDLSELDEVWGSDAPSSGKVS